MVKVIEVKMWGETVGALNIDSNKFCTFEYSSEWKKNFGFSISPIHLPLTDELFRFEFLNFETYKGLPGAFADTLPDDFGNAVINAWIAREGISKDDFNSLDRLTYQGKRGMGALEYAPAKRIKGLNQSSKIQLDSLIAMAQDILDSRAGIKENVEDDSETALINLLQVGTSAGGARPKAVIGLNEDKTQIRSGQVDLPEGFEHYLLKFDGVVEKSQGNETFGDPKGYGRMEYAYYCMAKDCGIRMSYCDLLEDGQRAHFITKRFDRIGSKKIHQQSLCAMDHADYKKPGQYSYEELFAVMRELQLSRKEAIELVRRMVFNVVARNQDDHTKNFGFLLNPEGKWSLSPAYDIAYSYRPDSDWVSNHQLSINGKVNDFNRNDLISASPKILRSDTVKIIDKTIDVVSNWDSYAKNNGVFKELRNNIKKNLRLHI